MISGCLRRGFFIAQDAPRTLFVKAHVSEFDRQRTGGAHCSRAAPFKFGKTVPGIPSTCVLHPDLANNASHYHCQVPHVAKGTKTLTPVSCSDDASNSFGGVASLGLPARASSSSISLPYKRLLLHEIYYTSLKAFKEALLTFVSFQSEHVLDQTRRSTGFLFIEH